MIVKPCTNCTEICRGIEELLEIYMTIMIFACVQDDVKSFWRTLRAFSVESQREQTLKRYYRNFMSFKNRESISEDDFVSYMMK